MKSIIKWYATAMSLIAAVAYILAWSGVFYAGDITATGESPPAIFFVAGVFYILVGSLIHVERRWLYITLGIVNALVILIFFQMWADRPDVLTSTAGLCTKIAQFLLEVGIMYLVINTKRRTLPVSNRSDDVPEN